MDELGLKKEDYDFYLDLRKYVPHAIQGLVLDFNVPCSMGNIRDVIPFPELFKEL